MEEEKLREQILLDENLGDTKFGGTQNGEQFFWKQSLLGGNFGEQVSEEQILLGANFWRAEFLQDLGSTNFWKQIF